MPFLTLNGITVPVASLRPTDAQGGGRGETDQGDMYHSASGPPRMKWTLETGLVEDQATAIALYGLLAGLGETFAAEDSAGATSDFGSKGSLLENPLSASGTAKFGSWRFDVSSAPTDFADLDDVITAPEAGWTVQMWHRTGASSYVHYGLTSDGGRYEDGAIDLGSATPFSVDNATHMISLDVVDDYDDAVIFPFVMPDVWVSQMDLTQAWSRLPRLNASGDFWPTAVTVEACSPVGVRFLALGGKAGHVLSVDLLEVVL